MNVLIIDHYDSFVYSLARYVGLAGADREVVRINDLSLKMISDMKPDAIILSPGPKHPRDFPLSLEIIREYHSNIPMLGVCLGHQMIAHAFGGEVIKQTPVHGRTSHITHSGDHIFKDILMTFEMARYHSLIAQTPLPECLSVTCVESTQNLCMGIKHVSSPLYGVQFHPESCLSEHGLTLIRNFLELAK